MRRYLFIGTILSVLLIILATQALAEPAVEIRDEGPEQELIYNAGDVEWQEGPASFEPGAEFSVLEGNPGESGFFNLRIRMPGGFEIAPHWHPNVERVTVISGTFHLGHGEELDRETAEALEAGSYFSLPPEMPHYAFAEGETVIQLTSIGPWVINHINPEDDPRNR